MRSTKYVDVVWIIDGGNIPNFGPIIEGRTASLPEHIARDVINKGWGEEPKPKSPAKVEE